MLEWRIAAIRVGSVTHEYAVIIIATKASIAAAR